MATGWSGRHDPDVAASLAGGPRGGRGRGAVVPRTRRPGPDPRSMGDVTRALALEFGPASVSARSLVAEGSVFQRPDGDLGRPHDQSGNCRDLDGPACRSPTGWTDLKLDVNAAMEASWEHRQLPIRIGTQQRRHPSTMSSARAGNVRIRRVVPARARDRPSVAEARQCGRCARNRTGSERPGQDPR